MFNTLGVGTVDSYQELETLNEIQDRTDGRFYVIDVEENEVLEVVFLYSNIYGVKNDDGYSYFASGHKRRYKHIESPEKKEGESMTSISPEDQKKARELERKKQNNRLTRQLKESKKWDARWSKTIKKQTTKKSNPFTIINGGKSDA